MNDQPPSSDVRDDLLGKFFEHLHAAEDPAQVINEFCAAHPELADECRELARMEDVLAGSALSPEEPCPEQLPDFRIIRKIAEGGMGVVYEAEQESLKRRVAVKVRRSQLSPVAQQRFLREQEILANLHQTHIVPIHTAGHEGTWQYFAMAYIDGAALHHVVRMTLRRETSRMDGKTPTLAELVGEVAKQGSGAGRGASGNASTAPETDAPAAGSRGRNQAARAEESDAFLSARLLLSLSYFRSVAKVMAEAAEALHHAHGAGVCHRDVKPSNIMVDTAGECWIIDFGLAGYSSNGEPTGAGPAKRLPEPATVSGVMGTREYMAPEQFDSKADVRTDVWGLGVTLYELLTSGGRSRAEVITRSAPASWPTVRRLPGSW